MNTDWHKDSLVELEGLIWQTLVRAVNEVRHPWSLPVLATLGGQGPEARIVVLREVAPAWRRLTAFSDARAAKVAEVRAGERVSWLFYDPIQRVQLRARGVMRVEHGSDYCRALWEEVPEANRANYRTMGAPGAVIPAPAEGHVFAPQGEENFAVLASTVNELDWLWLAPAGHRRARYAWSPEGWKGEWTVP